MTVTLQPVSLRGRLAAAATPDRFYLASHVEVLELDHPDRVFVSLMCCYARDVLVGSMPAPYDDVFAEWCVRGALIPDEDFIVQWHASDALLAERYAVPLDQIIKKREDVQRVERIQTVGWVGG